MVVRLTEQAGSPREAEEWTVGVAGRLALALEALDLPVDHDDLRTLFRPLAGGDEVWSFEVAARACGATIVELGASAPASGSRVMITADGRQLSVERTVPCVGGDPKRPRTGLARRYEGSAPTVWLAALAGTILLVPGVVVPALGRVFVDGYLTTGNGEWRSVVLLGLALCALVQVALTWVQYSALAVLAHRLNVRTSAAFTWHLLRLPAVHRRRFTAGDLTHRASLTQRIGLTGGVMLLGGALNVVSIVFYLAVMAAFDAPLAAIATVVVLVDLTAIRVVLRRRAAAHTAVVEARAALASTTAASIESIESIKAAADEPLHYAAWSVDHSRLMRATSRLGGISQTLATLPPLVHLTGVASVIAVGALQVMNGATTVGTLVAVQGLLLAVLVPVGQIAYLGNLVQDIGGSVRQTDEVLAIPEDVELASDSVERPASSPVAPTLLTGRLELHDVRFGYDPQEAPLLDGLDLVVEPGTWVAIVGASGSGKSTVARLATGLLQPWSGSVELDGVPRALVPRNVRTAGVAYVEQDITVVGDTVVDDLTLWDPSVPEADIVSALTDAALHGEVVTRPGGLQAVLHEGGSNLSGGQRQRLAIARALVRHPRLLVLDEATSALDPVTEEVVYTNLRRRCLTCLVIAHRLSTVRDADEIVVLEHGSVVQRGTHDQLAAVEGRYRTLVLGGHRDG